MTKQTLHNFGILSTLMLLLMAMSALAQSKLPITGHIASVGLDPTPGTVYGAQFQLAYCGANVARVFGTNTLAATTSTFTADTTGLVTGSIWPNDLLTCGGVAGNTRYNVAFTVNGSRVGPQQCFQVLSTAGTFNLDTAQPCATVPPPVPPTGAADSLVHNLTVTGLLSGGTAVFSGDVTASTFHFSGVGNHYACGAGLYATSIAQDLTLGCTSVPGAPVTSFNTRLGAITLSSADVTTALGFTPPTPTGTGASGTWPIAITGNSASATVANALATTPTQCPAGQLAGGITANGNANCYPPLNNMQTFSVAGCTPAASTDSSCAGTITLQTPMTDTSFTAQLTVQSPSGAFLYAFVSSGLTTSTIPYTITCSYNCGTITAPTIFVLARHN